MTFFPDGSLDRRMFHSGIVVPSLEETAQQYGELFGMRFARPLRSRQTVRVDGELEQVELQITYSIQGPPHLEIIQEDAGDVWRRFGLNHIGFWAEDIAGAMRTLERNGFPPRVHDEAPDPDSTRYSYHPDPSGGLWIELNGTHFAAVLENWLAGGA